MEIDQEWVPYSQDTSLYIRPTFIGTEVNCEAIKSLFLKKMYLVSWTKEVKKMLTRFLLLIPCLDQPSLGVSRTGQALLYVIIGPVGPYFATGFFNPVSLLADPSFVRACKGGVGSYKMGG